MNIAIIGRTQMLYQAAKALVDDGYSIKAVITAPSAAEYSKNETDFFAFARDIKAHCILSSTLETESVRELCDGLDLAVSTNWVSVLEARHLRWFRLGVLNLHAGALPAYRGNACLNWAILRAETEIGCCVHLMEADRLDCGRVIAESRYALGSETTIGEIYKWLEDISSQLFSDAVKRLEENPAYTLRYADEQSGGAFRCYPRIPEDSFINWNQSADEIHRLIRASGEPFQGAYTFMFYKSKLRKLHVLKTSLVEPDERFVAVPGQVLKHDRETGTTLVACGEGVLELQGCRYEDEESAFLPGRRWKGIRLRLGVRAEDMLWHQFSRSFS